MREPGESVSRGSERITMGKSAFRPPLAFFPLFIPTALALIHLLGGCGAREPDLAWQRIQEQGVIRVGMDPNWVPFEYTDGAGQLSGFDIELAQELGKHLGLEVHFVANLSFDGLYDALTADRVDAVISAVVVDTRQSADFAYSAPYFDAGQVLIVGPNGAGITAMDDLSDKVLAVELGSDGDSVARRWARRLADLSLVHADSTASALAAVADGRADAALTDRASALMSIKAQRQPGTEGEEQAEEGTRLQLSGKPVTGEQYAVVVRRDSSELLRALDAALADMRREGTLALLEKKWLGP